MATAHRQESLFLFVTLYYLTTIISAATIEETNRYIVPGEVTTLINCEYDGSVQWRLNGTILEFGYEGIHIIQNGPTTSSLSIGEYRDQLNGVYTCTDVNGNDSITLITQDYSLYITGVIPTVVNDEVNLTCGFESMNRMVTSFDWTAIDRYGDTRQLPSNGPNLLIPAISSIDNDGMYQCSVTLNTSVTLSTTVNISIITVPELTGSSTLQESLSTIQSSFQLPCNITGSNITYSWTILGSAPDPNYSINTNNGSLSYTGVIDYSDNGTYICTGTNEAGSISLVYQIVITGKPVILTTTGQSFTGNEGSSLFLPCSYQSNPTPTLTLSNITTIIDNSRYTVTNTGIIINSLISNDNGVILCIANNEYGNDTINYTLTVYSVPIAPTGLIISDIGSESVLLSWQPFSGSQLIKPDFYSINITSNDNTVNDRMIIVNTALLSQYNITGLIPNSVYTILLTAHNRVGSSMSTQSNTFTTIKSAPKFEFFNVTSINGGRSFQFDWSLLFDGGSSIIRFTIIITTSQTRPITIQINNSEAYQGSHTVDNLEANTIYSIEAILKNTVDSLIVNNIITTNRGPPNKPTKPVISDIQIHSVQLSFNIDSIGSEPVDYYLVNISNEDNVLLQQSTIESNHSHVLNVMNNNRQQTVLLLVTSLKSLSSYTFSVSAGGNIGNGLYSDYSDIITTSDSSLLYFIIAGVLVGTILLILVLIIIIATLYCIHRRRKIINQKHTITDRPTDFGFPDSSISETVHMVEEAYTPPTSSMEMRNNDDVIKSSPPPPPYYTRHHRTHSVTSTVSSQYRKPDFLRSPTEHLLIVDTTDSAYGGSAEKGVNHVYHEIPPRCHSATGGEKICYSFPAVNRVTSYDVDSMPPRPTFATNV